MMLLFENKEIILDFKKWMNEEAHEFPLFYYWKMIFDAKVLILLFAWFLKFINKIHFRFESLQLYTLAYSTCWWFIEVRIYMFRYIYKKFCNAKLAISKSKTPVLAFVLFLFFSIAIDQAHEQNNTVIKEVVGVVGLLSKTGMQLYGD